MNLIRQNSHHFKGPVTSLATYGPLNPTLANKKALVLPHFLCSFLGRKKQKRAQRLPLLMLKGEVRARNANQGHFYGKMGLVTQKGTQSYLKAGSSVFGRFPTFWPSPRLFLKASPLHFLPFTRETRIVSCRALDSDDERFDTFSDSEDSFIDLDYPNKKIVPSTRSYAYSNLQPNLLDNKFVVAIPNTVWSVDICKLKTKVRKNGYKHLQLFVAFDLATAKVITYFVKIEVTAMDIVEALSPHLMALSRMQKNKAQVQPLLIHSDRGSQFVSHQYSNMQRIFADFVMLSHSRSATPTDNSPSERLFRTLIRSSTFWKVVTPYSNEPDGVEDVAEYQVLIDNIISYYNHRWTSERALDLSPDQAVTAFQTAEVVGLVRPSPFFANNQAKYTIELAEVLEFRKAVAECYKRIWMDIQTQQSAQRQNQLIQNQVFLMNQNTLIIEQQSLQSIQLKSILSKIEQAQKPIRLKRRSVPRATRDAFLPSYLPEFCDFMLQQQVTQLEKSRNLVAICIFTGIGVRCSDIHLITHEQISQLIETRVINLLNVKTNRRHTFACFASALPYIKDGYERHCKLLNVVGLPYKPGDYFNLSFGNARKDTIPPLMQLHSFNKSLNKALDIYSNEFGKKTNLKVHFSTHSGRIGYVTACRRAGLDVADIAKLVDHKNIETTLLYDRNILTNEERLAALDKVEATLQDKLSKIQDI